MSNVIKFPAALKMLAATSGCPSRLILGGKNIFQDNCSFEDRDNNNHISSSEHVVFAPASR